MLAPKSTTDRNGGMIAQERLSSLVDRCRSDGATLVALFGSASRGEDTAKSDLDLLVDFDAPKSLLAFIQLERELTDMAERPVDLVTKNSLSPHLRNEVLSSMKLLYGA